MIDDDPISPSIEALETFIRASVEKLEDVEPGPRSANEGLLFLGVWHDTIPRLLIEDPVLEPTDKIVWQVIKIHAELRTPAAFPSYRQIGKKANIRSKGTVARGIAILRAARWLTLCARVRDVLGRYRGNVYAVHDEPLALAETLHLDPDYMAFLAQAAGHHHARVRDVSAAALATIEDDVKAGEGVTDRPDPVERRARATATVAGIAQGGFFSFNGSRLEELASKAVRPGINPPDHDEPDLRRTMPDHLSGVPERPSSKFEAGWTSNFDASNFDAGPTSNFELGTRSSCINNKTTTTGEAADLVFPERLDPNLRMLAELHLNTIPPDHHQVVLDELEGRIRAENRGAPPVYDPIRFLKKLCDAVRTETFIANLGLGVRSQREQRQRLEAQHRRADVGTTPDLPTPDPDHPLVRRVLEIRAKKAAREERDTVTVGDPAVTTAEHDTVTRGDSTRPAPVPPRERDSVTDEDPAVTATDRDSVTRERSGVPRRDRGDDW